MVLAVAVNEVTTDASIKENELINSQQRSLPRPILLHKSTCYEGTFHRPIERYDAIVRRII